MGAENYEYPPAASQADLDAYDIPFINRDKCATALIEYYKCIDKGTSYCSQTKDEFFKCQYFELKDRLGKFHKA